MNVYVVNKLLVWARLHDATRKDVDLKPCQKVSMQDFKFALSQKVKSLKCSLKKQTQQV